MVLLYPYFLLIYYLLSMELFKDKNHYLDTKSLHHISWHNRIETITHVSLTRSVMTNCPQMVDLVIVLLTNLQGCEYSHLSLQLVARIDVRKGSLQRGSILLH